MMLAQFHRRGKKSCLEGVTVVDSLVVVLVVVAMAVVAFVVLMDAVTDDQDADM